MRRVAQTFNDLAVGITLFVLGLACSVINMVTSFVIYTGVPFLSIGRASPFRVVFALLFVLYSVGVVRVYLGWFAHTSRSFRFLVIGTIANIGIGVAMLASDRLAELLTDNVRYTLGACTLVGSIVAVFQWLLLRNVVRYPVVLSFALVWFFVCWGYVLYVFLPESFRALS